VVAAYAQGVAGFITKPVDVQQFIATVGQLGNYWLSLVRLPSHPA
jgi:FixJ family two-component response regulator